MSLKWIWRFFLAAALISYWKRRSINNWLLVFLKNYSKKKPIQNQKSRIKREITINTQILFWNPSKQTKNANLIGFKEHSIKTIEQLASTDNIYLVSLVSSEQEKERIHKLLTRNTKLDVRRFLYCSTEQGYAAILKHISPHLHLDCDLNRLEQLQFIDQTVWVAPPSPYPTTPPPIESINMTRIDSLSQLELLN